MENSENMLEFITGQHYATVTLTSQKEINRIRKIYENRASEFTYYYENNDGSICAKIPKRWIKINPGSDPNSDTPKRTRTPEQIAAATKALAEWRAKNQKKK